MRRQTLHGDHTYAHWEQVLGERWHYSTKGFPPGRTRRWDHGLLRELIELLCSVVGEADIDWTGRTQVSIRPRGLSRAWAFVRTKSPEHLELKLVGRAGQFNLAQLDRLGVDHDLESSKTYDAIRLRCCRSEELAGSALAGLLREHYRGFREAFGARRARHSLQSSTVST